MLPKDIIRAWKDEAYRASLSMAEQAALPTHPSGLIDLPDVELDVVAGGRTEDLFTVGCCDGLTMRSCLCTVSCVECTFMMFCIPPI